MDFSNRLALDGVEGVRSITAMTSDAPKRILADKLGALIGLLMELDAIGTMDLVIGEDTILKDEPSGTPSSTVINPFIEDTRDAVANDVVEAEFSSIV